MPLAPTAGVSDQNAVQPSHADHTVTSGGQSATLKDDVRLAMPPSPSWYEGRGPVAAFLGRWVFPDGRYRLPFTSANGQPAVGFVAVGPSGSERRLGLQVLTVDPGGVANIVSFMDPAIAARFGPG